MKTIVSFIVFEGRPTLGMDLGEIVLSKCRNVKQAVDMLKEYNVPQGFGDHLLFADATGDSAVVEWVEGELKIIPKEGLFQLVTNFWLSNPELGSYPCSRYDKAQSMLEGKTELSVAGFTEILEATAQNWGDGGTRYSNIYDLKNKEVFVYYKGDFTKFKQYSLMDELKNIKSGEKQTILLDTLSFKQDDITLSSTSEPREISAKSDVFFVIVPISLIVIIYTLIRSRLKQKSNCGWKK